jgi:selenocysteine-specific elongation factor
MKHFTPQGSWHRESRDIAMMACTAGHVDHGKTSLVHWLTGCETDVLREEKERGLTIEVGFAPCSTLHGISVGITDVPGHERFVRNMVAGVVGIEMCILVIAADDGLMPQTIEHFQIMELLGVRHGIVALTKIDLVDATELEIRQAEIREWLDQGFLKGAPICPVSSTTGDGMGEFYDVFSGVVKTAVHEEPLGVFRMPIERVFKMEGFGRVLSGIPISGSIAEGDSVELVPGGVVGRLRGMQCFGRASATGRPGLCLALNIPDFARENPERGQMLSVPGRLRPSSLFHSRIRMLPQTGMKLKNGERVALHTNTAEVQARVYSLEANGLSPGEDAWVALMADKPLAAAACDRFIIRKLSPVRTLGGGVFREALPDTKREHKAVALKRLQTMMTRYPEAGYRDTQAALQLVEQAIEFFHPLGVIADGLRQDCLLPDTLLRSLIQKLVDAGTVLRLDRDILLHTRAEQNLSSVFAAELDRRFAQGDNMISIKEFQPDAQTVLKSHILERLVEQDTITLQGGFISPYRRPENLTPEQQLAAKVLQLFKDSGFTSPREDELPDLLQVTPAQITPVLRMLMTEGSLIRISPKVILSRLHFIDAQGKVVTYILEHGTLDSGDFKSVIQASRKYAISILEYLDRLRITLRVGDERKLATNYENRLLK